MLRTYRRLSSPPLSLRRCHLAVTLRLMIVAALVEVVGSRPIGASPPYEAQASADGRGPATAVPNVDVRDGDASASLPAFRFMQEADSTESVSLASILKFAAERSPAILVARSTQSRSAAAREAAAVILPSNPEAGIGVGGGLSRGDSLTVDVSLMQQLQVAGERGARLVAADRFKDLTDAEIEQIRWNVHCDVYAAYHSALVQAERKHLAVEMLTFQSEILKTVEQQVQAGEAAPLATQLTRAEYAQSKQVALAAQQSLFVARIRLAQLAGWPVAHPPAPDEGVDVSRPLPPVQVLLALAREKLPSLRARMAAKQAAEARLTLAKREAWPRPAIGVQYHHETQLAGRSAPDTIMANASLPLPAFQLNQGGRAQARAELAIADAELKAQIMLLEGQVAEARSAVATAAQRVAVYAEEILPRFKENLKLLRRSFELGEIDILALSVARDRFLQMQNDALIAQLDYYMALAGLERVLGTETWQGDHHEGSRREP